MPELRADLILAGRVAEGDGDGTARRNPVVGPELVAMAA